MLALPSKVLVKMPPTGPGVSTSNQIKYYAHEDELT